MNLAYVDTSAWLALMLPEDPLNRTAGDFYRGLGRGYRLMTSNLVLSEAYTWLSYRGALRHAIRLQQAVASSVRTGRLQVAWVTEPVHDRAWEVFTRFHDQRFSFCDCASFVLARDAGADFVFGFDPDFRIMGMELRPGPP